MSAAAMGTWQTSGWLAPSVITLVAVSMASFLVKMYNVRCHFRWLQRRGLVRQISLDFGFALLTIKGDASISPYIGSCALDGQACYKLTSRRTRALSS